MKKEEEISQTEYETLAISLAQTFVQRWELYSQQLEDGSYICVKKPLTPEHLQAHLRGEITLGTYLLNADSQAWFIVLDADDDSEYAGLVRTATSLAYHRIPTYLEHSRRGGHLWFFFEEAIPGADVRQFGRGLMNTYGLEGIELYPKQDHLTDGPGSLIRLPFGIHRKDGMRYGFVHPSGEKIKPLLRDQIPLFANPLTVSEAAFDVFWRLGEVEPIIPEFTPKEVDGDYLSDRIKSAIPVRDFVGQYVELSTRGNGHCPFHNDQHKSFSINTDKNYWHCFAGCGGGSVIDFWMKYKGIEFTEAIKELGDMLLAQ